MVDEISAELGDPAMDELIGAENHQQLADDIELLDGAAEEFDWKRCRTAPCRRCSSARL